MTQQQIAYRNLAISQQQADNATKQLAIAQQQADAATSQAATAAKRQQFEENKSFLANFWTGAVSTVGGIVAALLL